MARSLVLAAVIVSIGLARPSYAQKTFSFSSGTYAGSATFTSLAGNQLQVTLDNTSASDALVPNDVLSALFFQLDNGYNPTLTPVSAVLAAGSTVTNGGTTDAGGVVGGEWAYKSGLTIGGINPPGSVRGISSTGLGLFSKFDRFPGTNLDGPDDPDGIQYGLTTTGDNTATGNGGISVPLIKHSVVFVLDGWDSTIPVSHIENAYFQYGTDLLEPRFPGDNNTTTQDVPEPAFYQMGAAMMLAAFGIFRLRRKNRSEPI